jgi:formylglycine-generating enzyme required for sulfatase activity
MGDVRGFPDERQQAIVPIDRPFYMGRFEVTNGQYARFDGEHNSGVINERWKDRSRRGTPIDAPELPVVRINWHRAMAFCRWLSEKTGESCTLPTEAQWEWACRAGTDARFAAGDYQPGMPAFANIADETARKWNHGRAETGYNDGVHFTAAGGHFAPNTWGLYDMHGNVAEWCLSTYRSYPYSATDGRDDPANPGQKVVRGGSWNDTLNQATSASRWRCLPYKPVYNVGFRVVFPASVQDKIAAIEKSSQP